MTNYAEDDCRSYESTQLFLSYMERNAFSLPSMEVLLFDLVSRSYWTRYSAKRGKWDCRVPSPFQDSLRQEISMEHLMNVEQRYDCLRRQHERLEVVGDWSLYEL